MSEHRVKGITLDLGCTLLYDTGCYGEYPSDSFIEALKSIRKYLIDKGYNIGVDDLLECGLKWRDLSGLPIDDIEHWDYLKIHYMLKCLGITPKPSLAREVYRIFYTTIARNLRPYTETTWFLSNLRKYGVKLAIISNAGSHEVTVLALEYNGLLDYFDVVVSSQLIGYKKPSKTIFIETARFLGLEENTLIHIGDSVEADYEGALNAGYLDAIVISRHNMCSIDKCFNDLYGVFKYLSKYLT